MKRLIAMAGVAAMAVCGSAYAGSGGISPGQDSGKGGIGGPCTADRHGSYCVDLMYHNEHQADRYGLLKAKKTDSRGVSPLRGSIKLQKRVDGRWITLDRRRGSSRANRCHTAQRLRLKLPIMQMTRDPHRLIAKIDRQRVARLNL